VYLDGPWIGESIRSTFKLGGVNFEDLLVERLTITDCKVSAIVEMIPTMNYVLDGCMGEYTHLQAANEPLLERLREVQ